MEFKELSVKDAIQEIIDYRGKTPKKLGGDWVNSGIKALSAKNIKTGKIVQEDTIRYVDEDLYKKWMKQEVEKGTILITSEAPFGEIYYWDSEEKIVLSQRLFGIKVDKKYNSEFIYYYMTSKMFKKELDARATGSTVTGLRQPELLKCKIEIPEKSNQDKIAKILRTIDNKIELNNKINDNLLELCKNIYKQWFCDYKYENDILMKQSILGEIPENWDVREVQNITKIKRGASPRPIQEYLCDNGINWLKISDVTGINEPYIYQIKEKIKEKGKDKSQFIKKGTLVVSNSATPGIPKFIEVDTCVHDGWLILYDYEEYYKFFLYFLILSIKEKLLGMANGSVFQNLKTDILKQYKFVNPSKDVLIKFSKIIEPIMNNIKNNIEENIRLENIRDILLPKLMNGEINLDKIEI